MKKYFFAIPMLLALILQGADAYCGVRDSDPSDGRNKSPVSPNVINVPVRDSDPSDGRNKSPVINTIAVSSFLPSPHTHVQTLRFNAHEEPAGSCGIGRVLMNTAGDIKICQDDGLGFGTYNYLNNWKQSGNSLYPSAPGSVGIGTTAPAAMFHLKDGNFLASKAYSGSANNNLLYFNSAEGALMTGRKSSLALTGLSTLNLGIGSLSVGFDSRASGDYSLAVGNKAAASGRNSVAIGRNASAQGNNSVVINLADSSSAVGTAQANTMTILGGKVGIGVANPTYHLELPSVSYNPTLSPSGTQYPISPAPLYSFTPNTACSGAQAISTSYPDVVFAKIYSLMNFASCQMFGGMRDAAVALTPNVGAMTGLARASSWHAYSDGRFKTNLQPIENAMDLVERLNPVYYNWIIHDTDAEGHLRNSSSVMKTRDIGLIAQDVYKVIPEIVHKPDDESTSEWSLDYARLTPVLIQALKEHEEQNKIANIRYENAVNALTEEINILKNELTRRNRTLTANDN